MPGLPAAAAPAERSQTEAPPGAPVPVLASRAGIRMVATAAWNLWPVPRGHRRCRYGVNGCAAGRRNVENRAWRSPARRIRTGDRRRRHHAGGGSRRTGGSSARSSRVGDVIGLRVLGSGGHRCGSWLNCSPAFARTVRSCVRIRWVEGSPCCPSVFSTNRIRCFRRRHGTSLSQPRPGRDGDRSRRRGGPRTRAVE